MSELDHTKRKPYRITRGTYTRRDGAEAMIGGEKQKQHHTYNVGDDVDMTDKEAFHYGLNRLKPLGKRDNKTVARKDARQSNEGQPGDADGIAALIEAGEAAHGAGESREWRQTVIDSGVLGDEDAVPSRKGDVLDALRALAADRE